MGRSILFTIVILGLYEILLVQSMEISNDTSPDCVKFLKNQSEPEPVAEPEPSTDEMTNKTAPNTKSTSESCNTTTKVAPASIKLTSNNTIPAIKTVVLLPENLHTGHGSVEIKNSSSPGNASSEIKISPGNGTIDISIPHSSGNASESVIKKVHYNSTVSEHRQGKSLETGINQTASATDKMKSENGSVEAEPMKLERKIGNTAALVETPIVKVNLTQNHETKPQNYTTAGSNVSITTTTTTTTSPSTLVSTTPESTSDGTILAVMSPKLGISVLIALVPFMCT